MVYIINNYDGSQLIGINDRTINNTATSIRLPGRDYKPYGEVIVENLVWMLQNFSGVTPPLAAVEGQIWYDSTRKVIKVFDRNNWLTVGKASVGNQLPAAGEDGQLFYHTTKKQLFVWDLTNWKLMAPTGAQDGSDPVPGAQTGHTQWEAFIVSDTLSVSHAILKLSVGGTCVAIMSEDGPFNVMPGAIPGFATTQLQSGINLNSMMLLNGTATHAQRAITPPPGDSSTQIATTSFVTSALAGKANLNGSATQSFQVAAATLNNQAVNLAQLLALQPPGVMQEFAGAAAPQGWLLCDGAPVSRTVYSALFDVIGTTYGVGDGSTTFNVPDRRGRFGLGSSGSFPLGSSGGSFTSGGTALTVDQMPSHTHTGSTSSSGSHTHPLDRAWNDGSVEPANLGQGNDGGNLNQAGVTGLGGDHSHTLTINNTGGGQAHSHAVTPPYLAVNYIIKT